MSGNSAKNIWIPFGKSVIGASHSRRGGIPNQDALRVYRGEVSTPTAVAVSDGHGGSKYIRSDTGSGFAAQAIYDMATTMARNESYFSSGMSIENLNETAEHIKARLLMTWRNEVDLHIETHPLTDKERSFLEENCSKKDCDSVINNHRIAYGCTFLAALAYADVVLVLQYGDGDALGLYPDGDVTELIAADPRNIGNETLSLCTLTNPAEIRHRVLIGSAMPTLITLSTDGVKNSFDDLGSEKNGFYKIPVDLKTLLMKNNLDAEAVGAVLENELKRITTNGSGDDVTIGVMFDEEKIRHGLQTNDEE